MLTGEHQWIKCINFFFIIIVYHNVFRCCFYLRRQIKLFSRLYAMHECRCVCQTQSVHPFECDQSAINRHQVSVYYKTAAQTLWETKQKNWNELRETSIRHAMCRLGCTIACVLCVHFESVFVSLHNFQRILNCILTAHAFVRSLCCSQGKNVYFLLIFCLFVCSLSPSLRHTNIILLIKS